jgi:hypothetical protein
MKGYTYGILGFLFSSFSFFLQTMAFKGGKDYMQAGSGIHKARVIEDEDIQFQVKRSTADGRNTGIASL